MQRYRGNLIAGLATAQNGAGGGQLIASTAQNGAGAGQLIAATAQNIGHVTPRSKPGYVYVITGELARMVKIGYTDDFNERMKAGKYFSTRQMFL